MIVWGSKHRATRLGVAADYCLMCRAIRPFRITRFTLVPHLLYVGFGSGRTFDHQARCQACRFEMHTDPMRYTAIVRGRAPKHIEALVWQTFPNVRSFYAERLELDEKLEHNPKSLSPEDRHAVIAEVLQSAAPLVERHCSSARVDSSAALALFVTAGGALACWGGLAWIGQDSEWSIAVYRSGWSFTLGGIALTFLVAAFSGRRYLRRTLLPMIAWSLRPLQPSEAELETLLAKFRQSGHRIGTKLRPDAVSKAAQDTELRRGLG